MNISCRLWGLIFLRYAYSRYLSVKGDIVDESVVVTSNQVAENKVYDISSQPLRNTQPFDL